MASIVTIRQAAETLIAAATPDYRSSITFRKAPGTLPLADLPALPSPSETTRQFRVVPGEVLGEGRFNGYDVELEQAFEVQVRYDVKGDYPDQELRDFIAADGPRIQATLLRPEAQTTWNGTGLEQAILYYDRQIGPDPTSSEGVWIVSHVFRLSYVLEV